MSDDPFDMEGSRSARKSVNSRRRREVKNDDFDLDNLVSGSNNFDSITLNSSIRPPQPQPRRNSKTDKKLMDDEVTNGGDDSIFGQNSSKTNKPAVKAITGWGEPSASSSSRHRSPKFGRTNDLNESMEKESVRESMTTKPNRREITDAEELDIPEIPDMEETVEPTDMGFSVAEAPDVQVHQIATYKELDKEFFKEKAFQFLEGNIDVSLLHCGLNTEQQIAEEEDVIWDWTKLYTEVVSILSSSSNETPKDAFAFPVQNGQPVSSFGDDRGDVFDALKVTRSERRSQNRREIDL